MYWMRSTLVTATTGDVVLANSRLCFMSQAVAPSSKTRGLPLDLHLLTGRNTAPFMRVRNGQSAVVLRPERWRSSWRRTTPGHAGPLLDRTRFASLVDDDPERDSKASRWDTAADRTSSRAILVLLSDLSI